MLVHALAHAFTQPAATEPPPAWLSEGIATFMDTLWMERRQGREQALDMLEADRTRSGAGRAFEPRRERRAAAGHGDISRLLPHQGSLCFLDAARSCRRCSSVGCAARLQFQADDADADPVSAVTGNSLEKLLTQRWGEPRSCHGSLRIGWTRTRACRTSPSRVFSPMPHRRGTVLVAVNVANAGYASAEVPVTVRTRDSAVTERLLVPARGTAVQRILVMGKPTSVQVNDGTVPETQASVHITHLDEPTADPASSSSSSPQ